MTKIPFIILHSAAAQIINGDTEIVDPDLVRFDANRDYPVELPDGKHVKGRIRRHEGNLVIDLSLPDEMAVYAHFDMSGVRQVSVCLLGELHDLHAVPSPRRRLS